MARRKRDKFMQQGDSLNVPPLRPLNERQKAFIVALKESPQVIVIGPAGTGKTFISASYAADLYRNHAIGKIILTRPNVPGGRSLGYFPGTLEEKIAPWVVPFTSVIEQRLGKGVFETGVRNGNIEVVPFEVMRGRSFENAFVILDEAQNTTPEEMKMFLTRQGQGSQVVINGDVRQSDLKSCSGLSAIITMVNRFDLPVPIVEFGVDDIVRSDICKLWVEAFMEWER